ncbi:tRNA-2-methylthio-N6-dimethylallyladenosine synthase [Algoriphagus ratkowskyi]|uniref:tRNA-2-methylthio-N(6)-dimethylallyladenosine synthase n=1 Tax=Algoriphagus ratkowskyi TaxID=57028 RepID=A0A2W7QM55_9BACT|nr:tRNA (N6-isopentenyl adenosine(37)-C2)-methylthiotransferase MiaB [Algoriphagus ratkowskyi]PZX49548.1 tRNA-2-methylthio-N6-dimethylallyladenosine synthase [Algoriphagus ratkowskyi]TXD75415.1 tRNA (N6-isopentenyl adenosine(37)-C2)-methylthiotransferase MiaB [Algoriphagus ratkowskyi]
MNNLIADIDIISGGEAQATDFKTSEDENTGKTRKLYIESYGCAMNFADSEVVASIMKDGGFDTTSDFYQADVIFLNTCSIREKAELTVRKRLTDFQRAKRAKPGMTIGVLGCMAERLKEKFLEEEKLVDIVVGPDAYRDLPNLIASAEDGQKGVNTFLSREETYADISPVRLNSNGVTAFVSIMRGCDNMCSFCVVPFTRGRERSRDPYSIVEEAKDLFSKGFKEVTLLGQNVDSYKWSPEENNKARLNKKEEEVSTVINFANLLEMVALVDPLLRVRFSTSHPKDITDDVLYTIKKYDNICNYIHLPAQSGNSRVLEMMNRTYSREWYLERISKIREIIGDECGISSDFITGFCSETEEEHLDTLSLMDIVKFDFSYMFYYSERPGTLAAKKYPDDISLEVKKRRLADVIKKQSETSMLKNQLDLGKEQIILIESVSKKSTDDYKGRNSANKVVIVPAGNFVKGDYLKVKIVDCTTATLFGEVIEINPKH